MVLLRCHVEVAVSKQYGTYYRLERAAASEPGRQTVCQKEILPDEK